MRFRHRIFFVISAPNIINTLTFLLVYLHMFSSVIFEAKRTVVFIVLVFFFKFMFSSKFKNGNDLTSLLYPSIYFIFACVIDNCEICSKRDIAESNYVIHEVHCRRNIVLCEQCNEPVPRIDLETHVKDVHAPINCELCGSAVERNRVERHKVCCHILSVIIFKRSLKTVLFERMSYGVH